MSTNLASRSCRPWHRLTPVGMTVGFLVLAVSSAPVLAEQNRPSATAPPYVDYYCTPATLPWEEQNILHVASDLEEFEGAKNCRLIDLNNPAVLGPKLLCSLNSSVDLLLEYIETEVAHAELDFLDSGECKSLAAHLRSCGYKSAVYAEGQEPTSDVVLGKREGNHTYWAQMFCQMAPRWSLTQTGVDSPPPAIQR